MALRPADVGSRVVVRHLLADAQPGGPSATDVLGVLAALDGDGLVVVTGDGRRVRVAADLVVAARPVPPRAGRGLPPVTADALEVVAAHGWPARTVQRLGDWWLREAAGFTGRANSVLPVGDPGVPFGEALDRVAAFYRRHRLPPRAQVVVGSAVEGPFLDAGWQVDRDGDGALVQAGSVARARRAARPSDRPGSGGQPVELLAAPTTGWLRRYGRTADLPADVVAGVLGAPAVTAFAAIDPGHPGGPVAIGRAVVTGDWLGLAAVEVLPERRREGLARQVVDALLAFGAEHGARWAYLQARPGNTAALALYAGYGFVTHHRYRYLAPAAGPDPSR